MRTKHNLFGGTATTVEDDGALVIDCARPGDGGLFTGPRFWLDRVGFPNPGWRMLVHVGVGDASHCIFIPDDQPGEVACVMNGDDSAWPTPLRDQFES